MNVGIVGCGRVTGLRHLPALRTITDARVLALADVDESRLEALAREDGVACRYRDHLELIEDEQIEAVAVCVPAALHLEVALAALRAGKHVLIEKPLCLRLDEAARLSEAAAVAPVTAMVGFNMRRHRLVRQARDLVQAGVLGELEAIRTVFTSSFDYRDVAHPWRFRRESGGGTIAEMAPHHFDLWRFLTGREVGEVHASSRSDRDEDDTAVVTATLEDGVRVSSLFSQRSTNVNQVELFGRQGRLRVDCYRYDGLELQLGRGFGGDVGQRLRSIGAAVAEFPAFVRASRRGGDFIEAYASQWRHFLARAAAGRPATPSIDDGARNVEIMVAALDSAASGQAVPVRLARAEEARN